jgi:hypothetical protein
MQEVLVEADEDASEAKPLPVLWRHLHLIHLALLVLGTLICTLAALLERTLACSLAF